MSKPPHRRKLLPTFVAAWLAMLVYTFGVAAVVNVTKSPFWVAQAAMGVAAAVLFVWFWRAFQIGKPIRKQTEAIAKAFRKRA